MKAERQLGYEYKRVLLCQILCVYDKINVYLMFCLLYTSDAADD